MKACVHLAKIEVGTGGYVTTEYITPQGMKSPPIVTCDFHPFKLNVPSCLTFRN